MNLPCNKIYVCFYKNYFYNFEYLKKFCTMSLENQFEMLTVINSATSLHTDKLGFPKTWENFQFGDCSYATILRCGVFLYCFVKIESHYVAHVGLQLTMQTRRALNSHFSCPSFQLPKCWDWRWAHHAKPTTGFQNCP